MRLQSPKRIGFENVWQDFLMGLKNKYLYNFEYEKYINYLQTPCFFHFCFCNWVVSMCAVIVPVFPHVI